MDPGSAGGDRASSKGKRAKRGSAPPGGAAPKQEGSGDGRTINPRFVYCLSAGGEGLVAIALGDGVISYICIYIHTYTQIDIYIYTHPLSPLPYLSPPLPISYSTRTSNVLKTPTHSLFPA